MCTSKLFLMKWYNARKVQNVKIRNSSLPSYGTVLPDWWAQRILPETMTTIFWWLMKIDVECPSTTFITMYQTIRCPNPDRILNPRRCEQLQSYIVCLKSNQNLRRGSILGNTVATPPISTGTNSNLWPRRTFLLDIQCKFLLHDVDTSDFTTICVCVCV